MKKLNANQSAMIAKIRATAEATGGVQFTHDFLSDEIESGMPPDSRGYYLRMAVDTGVLRRFGGNQGLRFCLPKDYAVELAKYKESAAKAKLAYNTARHAKRAAEIKAVAAAEAAASDPSVQGSPAHIVQRIKQQCAVVAKVRGDLASRTYLKFQSEEVAQ